MPQEPQTIAVDELIRREAIAAGVPPELALAVAEQESRFNPTAVNPQAVAGGQHATGTFQLLPSTAKLLGVDPNNPVQNIQGGVKYLRQLMDRHQGDLNKVLAEYGGVKTDTTYVPQVMGRMPKFATGGAPGPVPGGPAPAGGPPPPPPGTFAADHPYLNAMVQGLDPHEQGGRRNIAGAVGGGVGGFFGSALGPWGTYGGAILGSTVVGGLEDLLVEQTGLGDWIGRNLPGGTVDEPVERLDPNASVGDRLGRAAWTGGEQGVYELGGQLLMAPLRYGGRALLESRVGQTAADAISRNKQAAVAAARDRLLNLRGTRDAANVAAAQAGRTLDADVGASVDAAREAARLALERTRTQQAEAVTGAVVDKRQAVRGAAKTALEERAAAQAEVAASEAALRAQAEADARIAAAQVEAAREAARVAVEGTRATVGEEIAQATVGKRQGVREAVKTGQAAREAARLEAEADIAGSREAYQAHLRSAAEAGAVPKPPLGTPSEVAAGRAASEVFEGPGHTALDEAGKAVTEAARTGPNRSLAAVQTEARRIVEKELAPHLVEFPRVPKTVKGKVKKPPMGTKLQKLLARIDDAQLQQLVEHPAMKVLSRVLNAPETVDFATLHALESSLRRSVQGSGDRVINSYVTDTTRHLVGLLRDTLAGRLEKGAAAHAPFEAATKKYADVVKLFTEGHAQLVKDATHAPEKIVQALRPDDPTPARMLVRVLTEQAEAGGGAAGKKAGVEALQRVQDAWVHRNLLTGPLDGLAERVATLRQKPEFVEALLHATPYGKQLLERAEQLGAAFKQLGERGAERVSTAREAARTAVGKATEAGEAAIAQARQKAAEAIKTSRATGRAEVRRVRAANEGTGVAYDDALKRAQAKGKARLSQVRETGREAIRQATEAGEQAIADARQKAAQAIRGQRTTGRAQVASERAAGATRQEAHQQTVEAARLRASQAIRQAGADVRTRAGSLGSSAAEQHERAFAQSPLNPRVAEGGRSTRMKQLEWAARAALAGVGFNAFGPAGIALGAAFRSGKKVPEQDLLRFVVHSPALTRAVIKGLFHPVPKQIANTVSGVAVRGTGAVLKKPPPD